jgi:hypothetical protein
VPIKFRKSGKFGQKRASDPFTSTKIAANVQARWTSKDSPGAFKRLLFISDEVLHYFRIQSLVESNDFCTGL